MDEMIKILIIGCGPHATHFYLPSLLKLKSQDGDLMLAGVLDITSQRDFILQELQERNLIVPAWFVQPFTGDTLSEEARGLLDRLVDTGKINAVIISTDPLNHRSYADWAISRNLPILLDKPVTTCENVVSDIEQANKIENDYNILLQNYLNIPQKQRHPFILCAHRRYHPGFIFIKSLIDEVSGKTACPVTNIRSMHADGQWRLPHEILTQKHHSYNQGYGKVSHSGFHFIDCVCEFWKHGLRSSGKTADKIEVFSSFVRANGLLKQLTRGDYMRFFQQDQYNTACPERDDELQKLYQRCGEIDAEISLAMSMDNEIFSLASIGLLHNSYSERAWLMPNRDLYKGNGRVKHEHHVITIGPFMNIQVHSYQTKGQHQFCSELDDLPGGNNHFEIYVFRNSTIISGKQFEKITLKEIDGAKNFSSDSLMITQVKNKAIEEWINSIRAPRFSDKELKSAFADHQMSVRLQSAVYRSYCLRHLSQNPVVILPWENR